VTPISLSLLTTLATVAAAAPAQPAALSFVAATGCPSREAFLSSVEKRGGDLSALDAAVPRRSFDVAIRREGEAYVGTLTADLGDASKADARTVQAATCDEVFEALSVTMALELGPGHATTAAPPPAPTQATTPSPPQNSAKISAFRAGSHWGHNVKSVSDGKLHFDPKFAITLSAGVSFGLLPLTTARYDATFRMANFVTLPNGEQTIIGPILRARLGFMGSPQSEYQSNGATVDVSGQSLGLGLCWSPHYDAAALVLLGCGELGIAGYATHVKEQSGPEHDSKVTLLGSVGPVLEAEYSLGPLQIGARLGGNLMFGAVEAQRADGQRLFESKRWETYLTLGVGGHW
jgi:hypothetical protein